MIEPGRDTFDVDYFLTEDLGERPPMPPFAHRLTAVGPDGNGGYQAVCACEWQITGYSTPEALAYAVEAHIARNTAGVMHKAVS